MASKSTSPTGAPIAAPTSVPVPSPTKAPTAGCNDDGSDGSDGSDDGDDEETPPSVPTGAAAGMSVAVGAVGLLAGAAFGEYRVRGVKKRQEGGAYKEDLNTPKAGFSGMGDVELAGEERGTRNSLHQGRTSTEVTKAHEATI